MADLDSVGDLKVSLQIYIELIGPAVHMHEQIVKTVREKLRRKTCSLYKRASKAGKEPVVCAGHYSPVTGD